MYYIEHTRANYTHTIGIATTKKQANELIEKETTRLQEKGFKRIGTFKIRGEREMSSRMRVKNSRHTYTMKESA